MKPSTPRTISIFYLTALWGALSPGGGAGAAEKENNEKSKFTVHRDIPYANTDNPRQRLDLIIPRPRSGAVDKPLPLLIYIHGGAWRKGRKDGGVSRLRAFVDGGGIAGVSIGYRLSGEAPWPAQIHDCKAAVRWVRGNADRLGLDTSRIAVWGTSAGGHLVAMLGTSGGVKDLEGDLGEHTGLSSRVACVIDWFGPSELLTMNDHPSKIDHDAPGSPESQLIGGAIQDHTAEAKAASPITYVTKDDPPFLIVHGTEDELVPFPQSVELDKRLDAAGVDSVLVPVTGGGHGGWRNPEVEERMKLFLDKHLLGVTGDVPESPINSEKQ